jgi:hypothetical protein
LPRFFPERTIVWAEHEIAWLRRWTLVPAAIGLGTGVVLRVTNSVVITYGPSNRWTFVVVWYVLEAILLCGAATLHLGNYPARTWLWRAPLFAAWETVGGAVASAVLIAAHREFWGAAHADFDDWPGIVVWTLILHTVAICLYSAALAGVVESVRAILVRREGTVGAGPEE